MARRSVNKSLDWVVATVYICLLVIGWLMLYATVYVDDQPYAFINPTTIIGRQSVWVLISLATFAVVYVIDWKVWYTFAYPIFIGCVISLVLVLIIGSEIKGARSWFRIGIFSLQPSEIAKFGTALAISSFLSLYKTSISNRKTLLTAAAIAIVPMFLILLQPDAGSALIFLFPLLLLYRLGLSELYYIIGLLTAAIFILSLIFEPQVVALSVGIIGLAVMTYNIDRSPRTIGLFSIVSAAAIYLFVGEKALYAYIVLGVAYLICTFLYFQSRDLRVPTIVVPTLIFCILLSVGSRYAFDNFLKPHQQDRINAWLNPSKCDPRGSLYNIIQSKMAIGSGGLEGKGFLKGNMTKFNYVPEQTSDFIFSTVGEEQGFIGTVGVIFLFALLIVRIIIIGERAKNVFIRNYAYSVAGIFFLHFIVNIGMSVGLMPVIGIPLPFLSKGGSALLGFTMMLAALLKMDRARFRMT